MINFFKFFFIFCSHSFSLFNLIVTKRQFFDAICFYINKINLKQINHIYEEKEKEEEKIMTDIAIKLSEKYPSKSACYAQNPSVSECEQEIWDNPSKKTTRAKSEVDISKKYPDKTTCLAQNSSVTDCINGIWDNPPKEPAKVEPKKLDPEKECKHYKDLAQGYLSIGDVVKAENLLFKNKECELNVFKVNNGISD